ncbi:cupin domain-containing protein, partial [Escherichia albertii]|uniref:cupin domain-containing protein n=1 Tax=Escherichia albertii TaxID=208962 RepID=UPI003F481949
MLSDELAQAEQQGLKIHAIFPNSNDDLREPTTGPYSSVQQMVLAFDRNILQATFKVSEEVIDELLGGTKPPAITRIDQFCRGFSESRSCDLLAMNKKKDKQDDKQKEKKKKKEKEKDKDKKETRLFNLFEEKKKIENCNGWSTTVTEKQLPALEGSNIGLFMVNLTAGSMMEPHWNTMDAEIVVVLQGRGMVRVCSPSITKEKAQGRSRRFEVEEGDVFAVPRFHPAAEMAFNNGSFVFMGFSRMTEESKAEFIAGESSVLQLLNKDVLQLLFNIKRATLDEILAPRHDSFISSCTSCAEEEMQSMHEGGGGEAYHPRRGEEGRREREESPHRGGREEEERRRQEEREEGQRRRQDERDERRQEEREEGMRTEEERRRGREERRWEEGE